MKKILKSTFLILLVIISMSLFTGCFSSLDEDEYDDGSTSGGSGSNNAAIVESLKEAQDAAYNIFKLVYDEIDGSMYYSDIGYYMDKIEIEMRNTNFKISETFPTGSMYYVRWIGYMKQNYVSYKLVYLEVQFNSNFKASKKQMGRYSIG